MIPVSPGINCAGSRRFRKEQRGYRLSSHISRSCRIFWTEGFLHRWLPARKYEMPKISKTMLSGRVELFYKTVLSRAGRRQAPHLHRRRLLCPFFVKPHDALVKNDYRNVYRRSQTYPLPSPSIRNLPYRHRFFDHPELLYTHFDPNVFLSSVKLPAINASLAVRLNFLR